MAQIKQAYDSKSLWLAVVISLLFSLILAIIIFRGFLFSPGLLEYGDLRFHQDLNFQLSNFTSTWNSFLSGNNAPFISRYPVYQFLAIFGNSYLAQRILFVGLFTIMGVTMYTTFFALIRKRTEPFFSYAIPIIPSLIFIMTPYTILELTHWVYLWSYAFIPLIFFVTITAMGKKMLKGLIALGIILSLICFISGVTAPYIIFSFLFIAFLIAMKTIFSLRSGAIEMLKRGSILLATTGVFYLLLASYWFIPWFSSYRILSSGWELPLTLGKAESLATNAQIYNVFRIASHPLSTFGLYFSSQPIVWTICTTIIPIMAFSSLLVRVKAKIIENKYVYIMALLAIVLIFLGKGVNPPFGGLYKWLLFDSPLQNINWVIKGPYRTMGFLVFCYAFLIGVLTTGIVSIAKDKGVTLSSIKGKIFPGVMGLTLFCSSISAYPLLVGNVNSTMSPIEIPQEYQTVNQWLKNQEGDFRVAWHPSGTYPLYLDVKWAPHGLLTPDPRRWVSGKPIFSLNPQQNKCLYYLMMELLSQNKTSHIGKLYSIVGVKYIVFQNNTESPQIYAPILTSLQEQEDLRLVKKVGDLFVFENLKEIKYIDSTENIILCLGGLDVLVHLIEVDSFEPNSNPIVFVEQRGLDVETLDKLASTCNVTFLFYGTKDLDDLALSTLDDRYFFAPYSISLEQPSDWAKDFTTSHLWIPYFMNYRYDFVGQRYDFDMGQGILLTTKETEVTLPVHVLSPGDNEIWVRTMINPDGGELEFLLDGARIATISTQSQILNGFKWVKVAEIDCEDAGEHGLTMKTEKGFTAINLIAIVPSIVFKSQRQGILDLIAEPNVRVLYLSSDESIKLIKGEYAPIFEEDFDGGSSKLVFSNEEWRIKGGNLINTGISGMKFAVTNSDFIPPYTIEVKAELVEELGLLGVVFAFEGENDFYAAELRLFAKPNKASITVCQSGMPTENLAQKGYAVEKDRWYNLKILVRESGIDFYVDGEKVLSKSIEMGQQVGKIGLLTLGRQVAYDYIRISSPFDSILESKPLEIQSEYHKKGPTQVVVEMNSSSPCILLYNEAYDGHWRAKVQGQTVEGLPVNCFANGFMIEGTPNNATAIELKYPPERYFKIGKIVSFLSLFASALIIALLGRKRRL